MASSAWSAARALWAILWRVVLFFVLFGVLTSPFVLVPGDALDRWTEAYPARTRLYLDLTAALAMLTATWLMTRFVDRRPLRTVGFASGRMVRDLGTGLAIGAAWLAASVGVAWAAGWVSFQPPTGVSALSLVLGAAALAFNVLTQQLLLCGVVLQTIRARAGIDAAVVVSALLFSAYHAGGFEGALLPALNVLGAGALFCLSYAVTGNLWLPMGIHFAWNFLLGPVLGITVSGSEALATGWDLAAVDGPPVFTGGAFGLEGGLVVTLTTAIAVAALIAARRRWGVAPDPVDGAAR